jgi:hypothetical protein
MGMDCLGDERWDGKEEAAEGLCLIPIPFCFAVGLRGNRRRRRRGKSANLRRFGVRERKEEEIAAVWMRKPPVNASLLPPTDEIDIFITR